jgi:hypothetical protein
MAVSITELIIAVSQPFQFQLFFFNFRYETIIGDTLKWLNFI